MKQLDWRTIVTVLIALIAFSVQWGVVTTKLESVEKRLDEFLLESKVIRTAYMDLERRVSFLEGQCELRKERAQ